jgi:hypothetical protein
MAADRLKNSFHTDMADHNRPIIQTGSVQINPRQYFSYFLPHDGRTVSFQNDML